MGLQKYNSKRNFYSTTEPQGKQEKTNSKTKSKAQNPIFVIQHHKARQEHYDFRIELNGVLISFAVPKGLPKSAKCGRLAVMVEDHPLSYANFEGIIPKGNYGAGVVEIYDKGYYIPHQNVSNGIKNGHIKLTLFGNNVKGGYSLVKTGGNNWLIFKHSDEFAKSAKEITTKLAKNPFNSCKVQLATLSNSVPTGKNWINEIKYDGYRILTFVSNKKAKLITRNQNDFTNKFPQIATSLVGMAKSIPMVLDGEVVCFDPNGKSDFGLLQNQIKQNGNNFVYVVFDILAHNGKDLRDMPLKARKQILQKVLTNAPKNIMLSEYVLGKGKECFALAKKLNLEGIVAKDVNSLYTGKRDDSWLKIKCYLRQEFVIGGYSVSEKNNILSAIFVGYYQQDDFIFVGKVGTGFSQEQKNELIKKFKKLIIKNSPFKNLTKSKNTYWLSPKLVCEVKFAQLTKANILRQPSFIGLRADKNPKDVKLEN